MLKRTYKVKLKIEHELHISTNKTVLVHIAICTLCNCNDAMEAVSIVKTIVDTNYNLRANFSIIKIDVKLYDEGEES